MLEFILAFLKAIPFIEKIVVQIEQVFTKTDAQKESDTAEKQQTEQESLAQTGRPKWD